MKRRLVRPTVFGSAEAFLTASVGVKEGIYAARQQCTVNTRYLCKKGIYAARQQCSVNTGYLRKKGITLLCNSLP